MLPSARTVARPNVADALVDSMAYGLRYTRDGTQDVVRPSGLRGVIELVVQTLHVHHPGASFQVVQTNRGFATKMHTDSGNVGDSFAMAIGYFSEGQLRLQDAGGSTLARAAEVEVCEFETPSPA